MTILPAVGDILLVRGPLHIASRNLLFLGVERIGVFGYRSIRDFSRRALADAARISPLVREVSMTLHGIGFGLDETEAFESEVAGIVEALDSGEYPKSLMAVNIIEQNQGPSHSNEACIGGALLDSDETGKRIDWPNATREKPRLRRIDSVGYDSAARPHAFVAMPFAESFEDVFY